MAVIERYRAEFDRMPHYGAEGCLCGNTATPDRECPLHAANWIIERLEGDLRGAVARERAWWDAYEEFERTGSMAALSRMGEAARRHASGGQ